MFNREHSFPKSWFGGKVSPMYSDIVHVVPCDGYVNNRRGHEPFGETDGDVYKSNKGFSKLGASKTPGYSGKVFEPNDIYKGDFARIYLYMATCYEDRISSWSCPMLAGNSYPAYKDWVIKMFLRWTANDPVSEKEINRMLVNEHLFSTLPSILAGGACGGVATYLFVRLFGVIYLPQKHNLSIYVYLDQMDVLKLVAVLMVMILLCIVILRRLVRSLNITQALKLGEE